MHHLACVSKPTKAWLTRSQAPWQTQTKPNYGNNGKGWVFGARSQLLALQKGRGACWSSEMGLGKMRNNSLTQVNLHKTNKQVGQHKVGAPLVLGKAMGDLGLTRLTTAQIRGKPPPSPIQYTLHHSAGVVSEWFFSIGTPKWESQNHQGQKSHNFAGLQLLVQTSNWDGV